MKKVFIAFAVVLLICSQAFAEDTTLVYETKGLGPTRDEAIKNALYQAVSQAKGVKISSGRYAVGFAGAAADVQQQPSGKTLGVDAVSVEASGTLSQSEIAGLVKTYNILEEKKLDDKTYEVKLKVWIYDYLAPDGTKRLRLAIMPIRATSLSCQFLNEQIPSTDIVTQLSHKLSMGLSETNKFAVLEREYILEFAKERHLLLTADAPLEEQAKLSKLLGADYMLVGTVSNAQLVKKQERSAATGYNFGEFEADFVFDYRLIASATMQVKLADTVNLRLRTSEIKGLVKQWDPEELDILEIRDGIITLAANHAVETIIDRLYPPRVVSVEPDGRIILNQGGKRFAEGMLFDVFTQGKEIIDSDTKESLGTTETRIATIKIDKVSQKISYATVVEGDAAKVTKDLICRLQTQVQIDQGRKSLINKTSTGGVVLPFDKR